MTPSTNSNQNSTKQVRSRITKAKNVGRKPTQKGLVATRNSSKNSKSASACNRTLSKRRGRLGTNCQKRNILSNNNRSRSSIRNMYPTNNNAVRHGRSTNASQVTSRTKKTLSSADPRKKKTTCITGRLNNKKKTTMRSKNNNNNNRQRQQTGRNQQKKKKKTASVLSLTLTTPSNLVRNENDFHREASFGTNE